MIPLRVRWCLIAVATLALLAGLSGALSTGLSTLLWLPSLVVLACDPASPVRRALERGLRLPVEPPPTPRQ
jgi:hypothetical protein